MTERKSERRLPLFDRLGIEEAPQHIAGDARDIVVVATMSERRRPGDRSGGKDGSTARRLEEGDVGAHLGMLDAVGAGLSRDQLLRCYGIDIAVLDGARHHKGMGWRAEALIGDVEFQP